MLRSFKDLLGFAIRATDGRVGTLSDVYFDDETWLVRYCVIDTGRWLTGRHVLAGSRPLSVLDSTRRELWVRLSRTEVRRSQAAGTDKPVSKQRSAAVMSSLQRLVPRRGPDSSALSSRIAASHDRHLRSCNAVLGHRLIGSDARIGWVDDYLIDDKSWSVRHLIVDTGDNVSAGPRVLVAPNCIDKISWADAAISVNLTRAAVATAPGYQPAEEIVPFT